MLTIEELVGAQADAVSGASETWDDTRLDLARQGPEGQTAYDYFLGSGSSPQDWLTAQADFPAPACQEGETDGGGTSGRAQAESGRSGA